MFKFLTVLFICILAGVEIDLFTPSFPELQKTFALSPFLVQFTLSANFLAYCLCSLLAGTLGDRISRRTVILVSLAIFVLGSLLCVGAINFPMLILGRILQGMGISGPSVLGYVLIAQDFPAKKQPAMMGLLNGIVTLAMAVAPILGSYVNIYYNWRGNFFVLLALGVFCLILSYFAIPHNKGNPAISLSPRSYITLLQSEKLRTLVLIMCFLVVPYWVYVGMSPILFIKDMGIELRHFGFYQGTLSIVFSLTSILSSRFLKTYGHNQCFLFGLAICTLAAFILIGISLLGIHSPLVITGAMLILSIGVVFPLNILYPMSLKVIENTQSRAAAMVNASRLIVTAFALEVVGFFYNGDFLPIALAMLLAMAASFWFIRKLFQKTWIDFEFDRPTETTVHH